MKRYSQIFSFAALLVIAGGFISLKGDSPWRFIKWSWPAPLYNQFEPSFNKFAVLATRHYAVDTAHLNCKGLQRVDTFFMRKVLDYSNISPQSTWVFKEQIARTYYYSIDTPVNKFYPVTVAARDKSGTALLMYLMNSKGIIKAHFKIGGHGPLMIPMSPDTGSGSKVIPNATFYSTESSERVNDSTFKMVSQNPIHTPGELIVTKFEFEESEIIVHRDARIEIRKVRSWETE